MDRHDQNRGKYLPPESSRVYDSSAKDSKITKIVSQTHTVYVLNIVASASQIMLGIAVILLAVLGFIQPLWLSAIISMLASFTTIMGTYFLYSAMARKRNKNELLHSAMQRIMKAQN